MRVTVWRTEVALYHGDRLQIAWYEHSFKPSERVIVDHANCVNAVWSTSRPVEVDTPPLCRLGDVELPRNPVFPPAVPPARHRLILPWDAAGWDATSVYHAAVRGLRGFRLASESACQPPSKICTAVCTPPETIRVVRWGIAFANPALPHHRSFLRQSSLAGPLASTLDPSEAASWADPEAADGWLRGAGLDPDQPVDVGWRCIWPAVAKLPAERLPPGAVVFEFPRASSPVPSPPWESAGELRPDPAAAAIMSKMANLHRRPRESAQALFAFSED